MKLSDFQLSPQKTGLASAISFQQKLNHTATVYPSYQPVHAIFKEIAETYPENIASRDHAGDFTYKDIDLRSDRLAQWLIKRGLSSGDRVGVFLDRSAHIPWVLLGILKAGGVYVPLDSKMPEARQRYILDETEARVLISTTSYMRQAQRLLWFCNSVSDLFFANTDQLGSLTEDTVEMMQEDTWKFIRREMDDDISGGGWKSSYTGEWLSREVMDDYAMNALEKLKKHVNSDSKVLEIGCASGITLFQLAPLVQHYVGTEIESDILDWTRQEANKRDIDNAEFHQLAAHEIDSLQESGFDAIVINSVLQCFSGHQYLRNVIASCMKLLNPKGIIFLGNVWDLALYDEFETSLQQFEQEHVGEGYATKVDRSGELFLDRNFIEDLRHDFSAITNVSFSKLLGDTTSELSEYSFDAILQIDKSNRQLPKIERSKNVSDVSDLPDEGAVEPREIRADRPAYIIFTSGTTGQPKGVVINHRAINRLVKNTNYINIDSSHRFMQTGSLAFDASTFEIWGPLLNGGSVYFPTRDQMLDPPVFSSCIQENKITTIFLTTGLFNSYAGYDPGIFKSLNVLLTGGENASVTNFNKVRKTCPELNLVHVYGPTENTTFSTYFKVDKSYAKSIPIGKPISNTTVYVLDDDGQPVTLGSTGEIYTGGDGLAIGYLNDPEQTTERFISAPFASGDRLYKTGDRGRFLSDGNIVFIGRNDHQVKVRGYRIELSEIEAVLDAIPSIQNTAVKMIQSANGDKQIIAYYTSQGVLDVEILKKQLQRVLPEYMIPSRLIKLSELPLNASGKVNYHQLPKPAVQSAEAQQTQSNYIPPSTELEKALTGLWQEVLNREKIGVTDDFFSLGGHSLKVTQLVSLIQKKMGVHIPLTTVFKASTVRELALYIDDMQKINVDHLHDILVPMGQHHPHQPAIILFPPGSGYSISYQKLANILDDVNWFGLTFISSEDHLQQYYKAIKAEQPEGPYIFMGYSAGGKLAFHLAAYFEEQGEEVSDIIMIDAARYYQPVQVVEESIEDVANDFLGNIHSPAIRKEAMQKIRAYRHYLGQRVEKTIINAAITNFRAEDSTEFYQNEAGEKVASTSGWKELTTGSFQVKQAKGPHRKMLDEPYLSDNCRLLKTWIQSRFN